MSIIKLAAVSSFLKYKGQLHSILFDYRTCQPQPPKRVPLYSQPIPSFNRMEKYHKRENLILKPRFRL